MGTNYKNLAITDMEPFYFTKEGLISFLEDSKKNSPINEFIPLLTCNRMEYYIVANDLTAAAEWLYAEIAARKEQPVAAVKQILSLYSHEETLNHIFNVVSGLESMVFGENEILAQVKEAYNCASSYQLTGPLLNKLFQSAVSCGKRVRTETKISQGAYSVSSIAIDALKSHHLDYFGRKILIIGMGTMGQRCLKKLHALGHPDITITNRSIQVAQDYATEFSTHYVPFDSVVSSLSEYDIIISAISRKKPLITDEHLDKTGKPSLLIDLGLPRNVRVKDYSDHQKIISVDGLKELAEKNVKRRQGEVTAAKLVIDEEYYKFQNWMTYKRENQH